MFLLNPLRRELLKGRRMGEGGEGEGGKEGRGKGELFLSMLKRVSHGVDNLNI